MNTVILVLLSMGVVMMQECSDLENIFSQFPQGLENQSNMQIYQYSGLAPNQIGFSRACLHKNHHNFYLLQSQKQNKTYYNGICVSKTCTRPGLQSFLDQNSLTIENWIGNYTGINLTGQITTNITDPFEYAPKIGKLGYLIIFILIFSISLSCFLCFRYKPKEREDEGLIEGRKKPGPSRFFKAFDIIENWKGFVKRDKRQDQNLRIFHTVKVIACIWIFLLLNWLMKIGITSDVMNMRFLIQEPYMVWIVGGKFMIDVFFLLSAFFGSLKFMKLMSENDGFSLKLWITSILKRLYRLWPVYVLTLVLFWQILPTLKQGPFSSLLISWTEACNQGISRSLLMTENLQVSFQHSQAEAGDSFTDVYCFPWGWFISADIQLYLFLPVLLGIYNFYWLIGALFNIVTIFIISLLSHIVISYSHMNGWILADLESFDGKDWHQSSNDYFLSYFIFSYLRATPYLIGIQLGFSYYSYKKDRAKGKPRNKLISLIKKFRLIRMIMKILGLAFMLATITVVSKEQQAPSSWGSFASAIYLSQGGNLFIIGFILFTVPTVMVPDSLTNKLFRPRIWAILSKLTFTFSLVGGGVILFCNYSLYQMPSLYFLPVLQTTISWCIYTGLLSLVLHLLVEVPLKRIGEQWFGKRSKQDEMNEYSSGGEQQGDSREVSDGL